MTKERRHNYLIGFRGEGAIVIGKDGFVTPFTLREAKKALEITYKRVIMFKLVPVKYERK